MWTVLFLLTIYLVLSGVYAMNMFSQLAQEIQEVRGVADSAIMLIGDLAQKIEECQCDPVALAALVASLRESREDLAFAVEANSPVPPPVDPVEPDPVDPDPTDPVEDDEEA
jgi:hypothetical protein